MSVSQVAKERLALVQSGVEDPNSPFYELLGRAVEAQPDEPFKQWKQLNLTIHTDGLISPDAHSTEPAPTPSSRLAAAVLSISEAAPSCIDYWGSTDNPKASLAKATHYLGISVGWIGGQIPRRNLLKPEVALDRIYEGFVEKNDPIHQYIDRVSGDATQLTPSQLIHLRRQIVKSTRATGIKAVYNYFHNGLHSMS